MVYFLLKPFGIVQMSIESGPKGYDEAAVEKPPLATALGDRSTRIMTVMRTTMRIAQALTWARARRWQMKDTVILLTALMLLTACPIGAEYVAPKKNGGV